MKPKRKIRKDILIDNIVTYTSAALVLTIILYGLYATASGEAGQQSQPPVRLILDGHDIATLSDFKYSPDDRGLKVRTEELLFECREGRIFSDRFEP